MLDAEAAEEAGSDILGEEEEEESGNERQIDSDVK